MAADRRDGRSYHEAFAETHTAAAAKLREAAGLAGDPGLAHYLMLRADALETDDYQPSDMAWLDMKDNPIDVIIGPIETYEAQLLRAKAAHEGFVLIKDMEWSERLARFAALPPSLQESLPVPGEYKAAKPGTDSDLNAYDAVYDAGDANAGAKTIAINLPNDEEVQLAKGTRRLQLKNAMQAKFDRIMVGIAEELIDRDQRHYVVFDAFFGNVMFHEVAHGMGIKNTIDGRSTVREALLEHASPMEEGKADVVGLHMVTQLFERGELAFRSVRFGAARRGRRRGGRPPLAPTAPTHTPSTFDRKRGGTFRSISLETSLKKLVPLVAHTLRWRREAGGARGRGSGLPTPRRNPRGVADPPGRP